GQSNFHSVPLRLHPAQTGLGFLTEQRRINIIPSSQHQPIDAFHHPPERIRIICKRKQEGDSSHIQKGIAVVLFQRQLLFPLAIGERNTNHRFYGCHSLSPVPFLSFYSSV